MSELGWDVLIACNALQKKILSEAVPNARFLELEGYGVTYGTSRYGTLLRLLLQVPKLIARIRNEHKALQQIIAHEHPDLIVSDNRYGFYSDVIPSILITHQLTVQTGLGKTMDHIVNKLHQRLLRRFTCCWIPDLPGKENLAGRLSRPFNEHALPRCYYLGGLSRFNRSEGFLSKKGLILVLLSGPEPQRSILEDRILRQIPFGSYQFIIVRGSPAKPSSVTNTERIETYDHLPMNMLGKILTEAEWVVSRSGYSSIMDFLKMGCKPIFIPTPGQAEQEYLAEYMQEKKWALTAEQKNLNLAQLIQMASLFDFKNPPLHAFDRLQEVLLQCLNELDLLPHAKSNFEKKEIE
jgi:hypothetical protein